MPEHYGNFVALHKVFAKLLRMDFVTIFVVIKLPVEIYNEFRAGPEAFFEFVTT